MDLPLHYLHSKRLSEHMGLQLAEFLSKDIGAFMEENPSMTQGVLDVLAHTKATLEALGILTLTCLLESRRENFRLGNVH